MNNSFRRIRVGLIVLSFITITLSANAGQRTLIDTHSHFTTDYDDPIPCELITPVTGAIKWMKRYGVSKTIIMSQPMQYNGDISNTSCRAYPNLARVIQAYPKQFAFSGGGSTLNPMLQKYKNPATITPFAMAQFNDFAEDIYQYGAIGYGEIAIDHLSLKDNHPYEHVPADHPFLLQLADKAAQYNMPISVHMEAIRTDMPLPDELTQYPLNPTMLQANITQFIRLLRHNRKAKIIWLHAGWDNTGHRSLLLMAHLLHTNPNLYIDIKLRKSKLNSSPNASLDGNWQLKPEWKSFIKKFKNRIMIGQDQHYKNNTSSGSATRMCRLLQQLDPGVRKKIAYKNAHKIFSRLD